MQILLDQIAEEQRFAVVDLLRQDDDTGQALVDGVGNLTMARAEDPDHPGCNRTEEPGVAHTAACRRDRDQQRKANTEDRSDWLVKWKDLLGHRC